MNECLPHPLTPSPQAERGKETSSSLSWQTSPELWEKLKPLARQKRVKPTPAEDYLWQYLRNRKLLGLKFRRQHTIERFIVDFYCADARLVIEVDGSVHDYSVQEDIIRQELLEILGLTVIRFKNEEITTSVENVLMRIKNLL